METKRFDCVEMKHKGAAAVLRKLKGKSIKEELKYWRQREKEIIERHEKLKSMSKKKKPRYKIEADPNR